MSSTTDPDDARPLAPEVEVRRSERRRKTVTAFREHGRIVVLVPASMSRRDEEHWVREMVRRVEARETRRTPRRTDGSLSARADELARRWLDPALGRTAPRPSSVTWVGNQRQRWGSCTPANATIRLSDRLQGFPDWVVDYVLVHELCHLVHLHHDEAFWGLARRYPRTEEARGYLRGWADAHARGAGTNPQPLPEEGCG
ncbi:M48 metallopeptidase family protein [Auraticoccus monumenti]|uniref:YgjP-like metallopeptidase domain-containing protein n=1 Tax=Auraticoccus monumenti TaxID=675864 RepID=A0A1G7ANH5_9ACTN|nr:M48 family metallopeptidase [Auraticoccus monumenti]SDE16323.1 hypothetical protein SAMN04489747_2679 [Auraticoccus monumenti]